MDRAACPSACETWLGPLGAGAVYPCTGVVAGGFPTALIPTGGTSLMHFTYYAGPKWSVSQMASWFDESSA
jgi:hypothetical protein